MKIEIFFSLDGLNYLNPSKHTLSIQITQNTNKLNMSTYTVTASVATHKKVFSQFASELRDNLTRGLEGNFSAEVVNDIQEKFDVAFDTVLAQVGKKSAAAPKKAKNPSKPNKNEEKRNKLIAEAAELGIEVADEKIGEIRKMISAHKKAQKKAAAEAKKAEKKAAAEAKKAEKKAAAEAKKAEKKAAQKAAKEAKAAMPKPLVKRLKHDGEEFTGVNGSYLRVSIARDDGKVTKVNESNWTEEGNNAFDKVYPTGFGSIGKKAKKDTKPKTSPKLEKKKILAAENSELIQFTEEQIATLKIGEMRQMIKDAKKAAKTAKKAKKAKKSPAKKVEIDAEKKDLIASLVGEAVEGIASMNIDDGELKEDTFEQEEEEDDEELELLFPGEDEVDEFEHDSLDDEKCYYLDEDYNIWDDEENHIGTFDSMNNVVITN